MVSINPGYWQMFLSVALLAAALLHLLRLDVQTAAVVLGACVLLWSSRRFLNPRVREPHCVVFGAAVMIVPLLGPSATTVVALFLLWMERPLISRSWFVPFLPLFVVALWWVCVELWSEHVLHTVLFVWRHLGEEAVLTRLLGIGAWMQSNSTTPIRALDWSIRLVILLGIASVCSSDVRKAAALRIGMVAGVFAAAAAALWQIYILSRGGAISQTFTRQLHFWDSLGRFPATFSDPNAFGVAFSIILPLLWQHSKQCKRAMRLALRGAVLLGLGVVVFSGSRSGALSLGIVGLGVLLRRRKLALLVVFAGVLAVAALNISPALRQSVTEPPMPESVRRVAQALVLSNLHETVFSRGVFWQISTRLLDAHAWIGVGLERYRDYVVPLSFGMRGVPPLWSDNANNFYLGLLVELGIVGALCFMGALSAFRIHPNSTTLLRWTVAAFAVTLLFGPHLEFVEVAILCGVLLAATVEPVPVGSRQTLLFSLSIVLLPVIAVKAYFLQYGFYDWERDDKRYFRWTGMHAQGWVMCEPKALSANLYLRAPRPHPAASSVVVEVSPVGLPEKRVMLSADAISAVELPCPSNAEKGAVQYRILVPQPYMPWSRAKGGDARVLGVQVLTTNPATTVPF